MVDEYKKDVERATQDIMKRPINKKVQFEGATFIIPENTRINPKHGNIVDEKTGYGIFISFFYKSTLYIKKKLIIESMVFSLTKMILVLAR